MTYHILVAEDLFSNQVLLTKAVSRLLPESRVTCVENGREAVDTALEDPPDLVLMDWVMPVMSGLEALKELKARQETADIPVIITTAHNAADNVQEALGAGAVDFVQKPFDPVELTARVKTAIRLRESLETIKAQKEELAAKNEELVQSNELKDRLFSVISHDLKSPLSTLGSLLELMTTLPDSMSKPDLTDLTVQVKRSLNNTTFLLNNLLLWSMSQMGRIEYKPRHVLLNDLADRSIELHGPSAEQKGIKLIKDEDSPAWVFADADSIDFVIRNLMHNAIKFSRHGDSVRVRLRADDHIATLSVIDTGMGMDLKTKESLFTRNVQSSRGTSNEKGTGLGLQICQEIVERHKGKIRAESIIMKGSTFSFTLPASSPDFSEA